MKILFFHYKIEKIIEISDPVYSFYEIIDCIDFNSYFAKNCCKTGRPKYNRTNLLKVILFSFMENEYLSLRGIEKSFITNRNKIFEKISEIIEQINNEDLSLLGIKFEILTEYAIKYIKEILIEYKEKLIGYARHI